jgi:hypothetical protein
MSPEFGGAIIAAKWWGELDLLSVQDAKAINVHGSVPFQFSTVMPAIKGACLNGNAI